MEYLRCAVSGLPIGTNGTVSSALKCRVKGFQDLIAVAGVMPDVHVGSVLMERETPEAALKTIVDLDGIL